MSVPKQKDDFAEFFPRCLGILKNGSNKPPRLATELISKTICECPKAKYTDLEKKFPGFWERQKMI